MTTLSMGLWRTALSVACAAALPSLWLYADTAFMWGKANGAYKAFKESVDWYADEDCTTTQGAVGPYDEGSNTYAYVVTKNGGATKAYSDSVLPDVPIYFGRDGKNIGSKNEAAEMYFGCGMLADFPQAYLVRCSIYANTGRSAPLVLRGRYTTLDNSLQQSFYASNIEGSGKNPSPRGFDFAGTFISAKNTTHYLEPYKSNQSAMAMKGYYIFSGDFSSFKGRWRVINFSADALAVGLYAELRLTSPTAMGDVSCARRDAFRLGNGTHLTIAPAVVQSAARGITIANSSSVPVPTVCLDTATGEDWTLSTPVYVAASSEYAAGATLELVGSSVISLASSLEPTNIVVASGVHRILPAASFAPDTVITVRSGATLVEIIDGTGRDACSNVAVVVEDGGTYRRELHAPYDAAAGVVSTVDATGLSAARGLDLRLDGALTCAPTSRVLRIATLSPSAGWTLVGIRDMIEREYGSIPRVSLSLEEEDGVLVLKGAVNPTVTRTGGDLLAPLTAQYTYRDGAYTSTPVWSDGLAAHAGADYVMALDGAESATALAVSSEPAVFPGSGLYTKTDIVSRSPSLEVAGLTLADGARIVPAAGSAPLHTVRGGVHVLGETSFVGPLDEDGKTRHDFAVDAALSGDEDAVATFGSEADPGRIDLPWNVSGSGYRGRLRFTKPCAHSWYSGSLWVVLGEDADRYAFGGDLDALTYDAVKMDNYSIVAAGRTMTLGARNRAFYCRGSGGFSAADGTVLTLDSPLAMDGQVFKVGAGTLKLNGPLLFYNGSPGACSPGRNNKLQVRAGYIMPPDVHTNGYVQANVRFLEGTGIAVAPGSPNPYGVYATTTNAFSQIGSSVNVRLEASAADLAGMTRIVTPVCTLTNSHDALTFKLVRSPAARGWRGELVREELSDLGLVRYSVTWRRHGLEIIVR